MPQDKSSADRTTSDAASTANLPNPGASREIAEAARANGGVSPRTAEEEKKNELHIPPRGEIKEAGNA